MAPLRIEVVGSSTIFRPAERAIVYLSVQSEGASQEEVSRNVATTAAQVRELLTSLAGKSDQGEALPDAPISHWSNSSLSTGSYFRYSGDNSEIKTRVHEASMSFEARFQDFAKLGAIATQLSTMEHVSISSLLWKLTDETQQTVMSECRTQAVQDALTKAKDFAGALGKSMPPVVEVKDSSSGSVYAMAAQGAAMVYRAASHEQEEFNFSPEKVSLDCNVTVVFEEK